MTRLEGFTIVTTLWLMGAYINTGYVLADWEYKFPTSPGHRSKHIGFAVGFSLAPPAWLVTTFATNFYEAGWMKPTLGNVR